VIRILYVEHSEDNLYMLKTRLELLGDFECATGQAAAPLNSPMNVRRLIL
jgi:hypothetical protein